MSERKCPECGERLSFDAIRCACGWGVRKGEKLGKVYDHQCTFRSGGSRCAYPVGMFPEGATQGWCVFHRQQMNPADAAGVVEQSRRISYADAIQPMIERNKGSVSVVNTAHEIALLRGNNPWPSDADRVSAKMRKAA